MSLSQLNIGAKNIDQLKSWFIDIVNHLGNNNNSSGSFTPSFTGLTGSPTVTGFYHRWGKLLSVIITLDGDQVMSSAYVSNLPYKALENGVVTIVNVTDNSLVGHSYIEKDSNNLHIPDYSLSGKVIVIKAECEIDGI